MSAGNDEEFIRHLQKKEGDEAMKCPLLWSACLMSHRLVKRKDGDCLKEECAWWDEEEQSCDPSGLRHFLKSLIAQVWALTEKIPRSDQFLTKP